MLRARVLRAAEAAEAVAARGKVLGALPSARRVSAAEVAARHLADRILADARGEADRLVLEARRAADEQELGIVEAARADALAHVADALARVRVRERALDEGHEDRVVTLATLLAERLLGEVLAIDPARVAALARTALEEATGARAVAIVAHPEDASALRRVLASDHPSVQVRDDPALARGDLRIETDIGVLEAKVGDRIERLGERLRESLAR